MKHKVKADTLNEFLHIFDALFARLDQTGEKIVGARLPFNPVYATVRLVPTDGAGETPTGKGVGR